MANADEIALPPCVYVLVRSDLPLPNQIVQVGHACWEAAARWGTPGENCTMVVLSVASQMYLREAVAWLEERGVQAYLFHETDFPRGDTAACTEPLDVNQRSLMRKFQMWK